VNQSEQLSALMDGELPVEAQVALSRKVLQDTRCQHTLVRYQKTRRLLQQDRGPDAANIAVRVQAVLTSEPAILAPKMQRKWFDKAPRRFWGLALAATAALFAINLGSHYLLPTVNTLVPISPLVARAPVHSAVQQQPAYLNRYLSEHHAYVGTSHVTQPSAQLTLAAVHYVE
jgi:negative regulator of sigma E activity